MFPVVGAGLQARDLTSAAIAETAVVRGVFGAEPFALVVFERTGAGIDVERCGVRAQRRDEHHGEQYRRQRAFHGCPPEDWPNGLVRLGYIIHQVRILSSIPWAFYDSPQIQGVYNGFMRDVFGNPRYTFLAILTASGMFLVQAWFPLLPLLAQFEDGARTLDILPALLAGSFTDIDSTMALFKLLISLFIGINVSLFVFYVRHRRTMPSSTNTAVGLVGMAASLFGIGCAACGSAIFVSLLGTGGAALFAFLPAGGYELNTVGIFLLALSCFFLVRAINKPGICPA